jgi:hypothetical protein
MRVLRMVVDLRTRLETWCNGVIKLCHGARVAVAAVNSSTKENLAAGLNHDDPKINEISSKSTLHPVFAELQVIVHVPGFYRSPNSIAWPELVQSLSDSPKMWVKHDIQA